MLFLATLSSSSAKDLRIAAIWHHFWTAEPGILESPFSELRLSRRAPSRQLPSCRLKQHALSYCRQWPYQRCPPAELQTAQLEVGAFSDLRSSPSALLATTSWLLGASIKDGLAELRGNGIVDSEVFLGLALLEFVPL